MKSNSERLALPLWLFAGFCILETRSFSTCFRLEDKIYSDTHKSRLLSISKVHGKNLIIATPCSSQHLGTNRLETKLFGVTDMDKENGDIKDGITGDTMQSSISEDLKTQVGSKEYYEGFISRGLNEEPVERVSGDALLGPILKFAASASIGIAFFLVLFLASNGLLSFPSSN